MRCTGATGQSLNAHRGLKWAAEYLSEKLWRTFAGTVFLQTGCMVYCQTDRRFIGLILQGLANLWPGLNIYGRDCQIIRFVIRSYKVKTSLQADRWPKTMPQCYRWGEVKLGPCALPPAETLNSLYGTGLSNHSDTPCHNAWLY